MPLLAQGFGLADRESGLRWSPATASNLGSITKQFTGAAILALEEEKKLGVGDPVTRYFDGVPADKASITLHQLLTHSSGLADPGDIGDYDPVPLPEYLRRVFAEPLLFTPGTGYEYSNANYSLLGAVIEKLTGLSYEAYLRERFFLRAGLYETGYLLPYWGDGRTAQGYVGGKRWGTVIERSMAADGPHWALRANGGIQSTVYDMLRWARALLAGRVLAPESMKKLWAPHVSEGGDTFYGYGWSIAKAPDGAKIVTHNGGNGVFFADFAIVPDTGLVVFLMTNVVAETQVASTLLERIGLRFHEGRPLPSIPEIVDLDPPALAAVAGTYLLPLNAGAFRLTIGAGGTSLFIEAEGRPAFALLNSVRGADAARLEKLSRLADGIVAGNRAGDLKQLFDAYKGRVPIEQLESGWAELSATVEADNGRILRHEVLGTARTQEGDETVVRLHCEKGTFDLTYVWDLEVEGKLLGRSRRGLAVRQRLYASGERDFFTWDGGIRPPKLVRIEKASDGRSTLRLGEHKAVAVR
ncbi:MAG: beta-lactamase family protein [Candidatus Moduliflexus flocculans]|nr:beta-lactamase family protein [Candidatus Moduliflexus flocculans]